MNLCKIVQTTVLSFPLAAPTSQVPFSNKQALNIWKFVTDGTVGKATLDWAQHGLPFPLCQIPTACHYWIWVLSLCCVARPASFVWHKLLGSGFTKEDHLEALNDCNFPLSSRRVDKRHASLTGVWQETPSEAWLRSKQFSVFRPPSKHGKEKMKLTQRIVLAFLCVYLCVYLWWFSLFSTKIHYFCASLLTVPYKIW